MRFPIIPLLLLALPFLEIAGFVIVGRQIGVFYTLALAIASGVLGAILLRIQGFGVMGRIRKEFGAGHDQSPDPGRELANGAMILLAGMLLLIPGFVTDVIGLLLFLPPVRNLAWRSLKSRVVVSAGPFGGFTRPGTWSGTPRNGRRDGKTIDLDADEYSSASGAEPRPESPWRRIDGD